MDHASTARSVQCPSCSAAVSTSSRFCSSCGQAISTSQLETASILNRGENVPPSTELISSDSDPAVGFTPGVILASRYRIFGLLGRGAMGEVYRADDLKLGQTVALKFLPKALAADPVRRERFLAEVRIARQLAHPNICRVYDITEIGEQHFLSMEYIDGEDLASLIQRIGYLPNEKALEIARQLAAGLAAAHDKGVLHRDLKPANIMIDGRGRVRITDFGLAVVNEDESERAKIAGTPAYMAPEQFTGKGASARSDIYALGLILYEVFSGRKAFTAATMDDLRRQKEGQVPLSPSLIREDLNPVVERLIMRCLERDPRARPASVTQVALALPGGDPLTAAIAAGETPSPEMVAASGMKEGLRPAIAWLLLLFLITGSIASISLNRQTMLLQLMPAGKSPEVLVERSREFLRKAGYAENFADSAYGFQENSEFLQYIEDSDKTSKRWNNLDPGAIIFWYRQSQHPLEPSGSLKDRAFEVTPNDPPLQFSGDAVAGLDTQGNLLWFRAIPPQVESTATPALTPDWSLLFSTAGLDASKWTPASPEWNPLFYADARAAWNGSLRQKPNVLGRIEAAAYKGMPVSFEIVGPWTRATRVDNYDPQKGQRIGIWISILTLFTLIGGGLFFARRNLRLGRGDRRGATRLAVFVLLLIALDWVFSAHHVATFWELGLFIMLIGWTLSVSGCLWVVYIALEPFVRRRWPQILISWTRLLAGEWRDPLVGRDLLVGCAIGLFAAVTLRVGLLLPSWLGYPSGARPDFSIDGLSISKIPAVVGERVFMALGFLCLLFFLQILLRKNSWAAAAWVLVISLPDVFLMSWMFGIIEMLLSIILYFIVMRFGLLTMVSTLTVLQLYLLYPMTLQPSAWYSTAGYAALFVISAIALFGFWTSFGGRPILDSLTTED